MDCFTFVCVVCAVLFCITYSLDLSDFLSLSLSLCFEVFMYHFDCLGLYEESTAFQLSAFYKCTGHSSAHYKHTLLLLFMIIFSMACFSPPYFLFKFVDSQRGRTMRSRWMCWRKSAPCRKRWRVSSKLTKTCTILSPRKLCLNEESNHFMTEREGPTKCSSAESQLFKWRMCMQLRLQTYRCKWQCGLTCAWKVCKTQDWKCFIFQKMDF